jgi:TonB-linked SusC/RagA family outer membrane protein
MGINSGVNDLGSSSITTYNGDGTVSSNELNSALLSFFARLNYNYKNKYLLSLSIRSDKSSKFADGHRVGWFPSVSAGWNIHEEEFFKVPWIHRLKLRASYGEMGANFINPYQFTNLAYGPVATIFNNKRQYGYVTRLMQQTLTWEKAISANVGLEVGLFDNALTFTAEYFWRKNKDLLAPLESLPSSGQTIVINDGELNYYNTASVENKGFEFTIGYNKSWGDWSFNAQGNITFLKNKVVALGEGVQPIRGSGVSSKYNDRATLTQEGLPIGSFYGYKVVGVSQTTGNFLFEGADGTAKESTDVTQDDKQVIGNPNPDFTFGMNFNVGYKNWDLTAFFQGTVGNDIYAAAKYHYIFNPDANKLVEAANSWTPTNKSTSLCIANVDNFAGSNSLPSSYYVQNGSYLRLKNLQIGYTFDKKLLNKIGVIESLRLFASVQNLFTITGYDLYDPEVSSNTLFDRGVDGIHLNAPAINARTYNFGFNVTF